MIPEHWARVVTLFHRVLDLEPHARAAFLELECGGDDALRRELEALVRSHRVAADEIRTAVEQEAASLLQGATASGERLGAWRLLRPLQHGGMGTVYLAERADDVYRKAVAIKVLRNPLPTEYERERFRTERQILADLEHACIARLIDGGKRADGSPYLVMEYVEGEPIDRYCSAQRLLLEERLRLFQQVCLAVAHAHRQHVVHRDLKPANILVGKDGVPKLLDFGIAKLLDPATDPPAGPPTRAEDRRLTPQYASPEQLSGAPIGFASDIYALGVVLYELLTGCLPYQFDGLSFDEMLQAMRQTDPLPPSLALARRPLEGGHPASRLRGDLDNIVVKALQREPHARYATADEMAADIARYLAGEPVSARASALAQVIRFARGHRKSAVAALALLACAVPATIYVKGIYDDEQRIRALVATHSSAQSFEALPAIAILPFGSAEGGTLLGVGMSRQLRRSLSPLRQLRVTAHDSVRHFAGAEPDIGAVARELAVRYVVSGRLQSSGSELRVETTLTDAAGGRQLWTARYQRNLEDFFAIRTELVEKIAASLGIELSADERQRLGRAPTRSVEAYHALLQGMPAYSRQRQRANEDARRHFQRAIELEPNFAAAHGLLAMIYLTDTLNDWSDNPAESLARAERLAKRALELDDGDAFVQLAMAMVRREQGRHAEALAAAARAVELDPNYANAIVLLASLLCSAGKTENTIELIQKAVRLNPRFPINYPVQMGWCYFVMGRYGEAIAAFEHALDKNALGRRGLLLLAASYAQAGRLDDARWTVTELKADGRQLSLRDIEPSIPFTRREDRERVIEGLRRAGVGD